MAPSALSFVRRAQSEALFGLPFSTASRRSPYITSLGADGAPFDLNGEGVVREIKAALRALAEAGAANKTDPVLETAWKGIADNDTWDYATALEFALFVSRFAPQLSVLAGVAGREFVQSGTYPSMPQPTVAGLELLASAVNERLAGKPSLSTYQSWRGGMFKPPSTASAPGPDAVCTPTVKVWPNVIAPGDATKETLEKVAAADLALKQAFSKALDAPNENDRAIVQFEADGALRARNRAVDAAVRSSASGTTAAQGCKESGGEYDFLNATCVIRKRPPSPLVVPTDKPEDDNTGLWVLGGIAIAGVIGFAAWSAYGKKGRK